MLSKQATAALDRTSGPWTVDQEPNPAYSDKFSNAYTLRWNGLVRGQIYGYVQSGIICGQLNLGNAASVGVES